MNRMQTIVQTLISFGLVSITTLVLADDTRQQIEDQLQAFLAHSDTRAAHETFWADDLIYTSSSGERFNKAFILSGFDGADASEENSKVDDDANETADESEIEYSGEDIDIRLFDDVAVVAFRLIGSDANSGERLEYFNTGTLIRRDGFWQVVAWQATKIPRSKSN